MADSTIAKKYRTLFLISGALLALPSAVALLTSKHGETGLQTVLALLLVVGLFLLGRAVFDNGEGLDEKVKEDLEVLSSVPAPVSYLENDLETYSEVFKPKLFGAFGARTNLWISKGVLRSRSLLRTREFPLKDARGFAIFEFSYPRRQVFLHLCDSSANSRIKIDLLAFECSSLVRFARENLNEVALEVLR